LKFLDIRQTIWLLVLGCSWRNELRHGWTCYLRNTCFF